MEIYTKTDLHLSSVSCLRTSPTIYSDKVSQLILSNNSFSLNHLYSMQYTHCN